MVFVVTRRNWILLGSLTLALAGYLAMRLLDEYAPRVDLRYRAGRLTS